MKKITKQRVKTFVKEHKAQLFLGGIFTVGALVGYRLGYVRASSFNNTIDNALHFLDTGGIEKSVRKGNFLTIYFDSKKYGKGIGLDLDRKEAEKFAEYVNELLKEVK